MSLNIWFLNVGHGDCTIIKFPSERIAIVDINNAPALDEESEKEIALSVAGLTEAQYTLRKALGSPIQAVKDYDKLLRQPGRVLADPLHRRDDIQISRHTSRHGSLIRPLPIGGPGARAYSQLLGHR